LSTRARQRMENQEVSFVVISYSPTTSIILNHSCFFSDQKISTTVSSLQSSSRSCLDLLMSISPNVASFCDISFSDDLNSATSKCCEIMLKAFDSFRDNISSVRFLLGTELGYDSKVTKHMEKHKCLNLFFGPGNLWMSFVNDGAAVSIIDMQYASSVSSLFEIQPAKFSLEDKAKDVRNKISSMFRDSIDLMPLREAYEMLKQTHTVAQADLKVSSQLAEDLEKTILRLKEESSVVEKSDKLSTLQTELKKSQQTELRLVKENDALIEALEALEIRGRTDSSTSTKTVENPSQHQITRSNLLVPVGSHQGYTNALVRSWRNVAANKLVESLIALPTVSALHAGGILLGSMKKKYRDIRTFRTRIKVVSLTSTEPGFSSRLNDLQRKLARRLGTSLLIR
jgi:hypothetical protein